MQIGSAWTKTEEKEGKKTVNGISITLDDAITEVYPILKSVRFMLKPLTPEQRKSNDKAPNWRLLMYKPQQQSAAASSDVTEDIPF